MDAVAREGEDGGVEAECGWRGGAKGGQKKGDSQSRSKIGRGAW